MNAVSKYEDAMLKKFVKSTAIYKEAIASLSNATLLL